MFSHAGRREFLRTRTLAITACVIARATRRSVSSVESLSAGGAVLVGDLALSPGEEIQVLLGIGGAPVLVSARVVRIHGRTERQTAIAVAFLDVPRDIEGRIQVLVLSALDRERAGSRPAVVVIGADAELRAKLERDFERLGRDMVVAATALEVIWHLEDRDRTYDAVLVDLDREPAELKLLRHIAESHPAVARIAMSCGPSQSSAIQSLLTKPFDSTALANALRVPAQRR